MLCPQSSHDNNGDFIYTTYGRVSAPHHAQVKEGITGTCVVMFTPDSERTMHTFLGITAELSPQELDLTALSQAQYLYIEGYLATSTSARHAVSSARALAQAQRHKNSADFF
ncbi:MAG: hypothetical protein IPI79_15230 [Moraxellaceae bacterium]|nr:hypothetical protein [Moraxellaceae bacterium]